MCLNYLGTLLVGMAFNKVQSPFTLPYCRARQRNVPGVITHVQTIGLFIEPYCSVLVAVPAVVAVVVAFKNSLLLLKAAISRQRQQPVKCVPDSQNNLFIKAERKPGYIAAEFKQFLSSTSVDPPSSHLIMNARSFFVLYLFQKFCHYMNELLISGHDEIPLPCL